MLRFFLTIIFLFLTLNSNADVKKKIIENLKNTKNLNFDTNYDTDEITEFDNGNDFESIVENKSVECEEVIFEFDLDDFSQKRILEGIDKIDITLDYEDQIKNYSNARKSWKPRLV